MTPLRIVGQVSAPRPADQLREARSLLVAAQAAVRHCIELQAARDGVVTVQLLVIEGDLGEHADTLGRIGRGR